jgi:multicomponent Na+:H+ antiporter subunit F
MTPAEFLDICLHIGFFMITAALGIAFIRLALGPSLADRVVALDMMNVTVIGFCGLYAILMREPSFLDVAIVLALVGFLATVALARYAERRFLRDKEGYDGKANKDD